MKKVFITGLALLCAATAFAQNTTINFPAAVSLSIGTASCLNGATYVTVNGNSISTDGTITASACGTTTGGQTPSAVTVTLMPSSYLAGDTAPADFPVVKWSSTDAGMSCNVPSPPAGFTVSSTTGSGTTGSITLAPPAAAPVASSYTFAVTCGTTTTNAYASPASTSKTLMITSSTGTGGGTVITDPTVCANTPQPSSRFSNGTVLTRQCTGNVYWGPLYYSNRVLTGLTMLSLGQVFAPPVSGAPSSTPTNWPTYGMTGAPFTPYVNGGQYVALAFTPTTSNVTLTMDLVGNYGTWGTFSISTTPGNFNPASASCVTLNGGNLSAYSGAIYPAYCQLIPGTTYYLNFAAVDNTGTQRYTKSLTLPVPLSYSMFVTQ